jgi:hypothetical protein
MIMTSIFHYIDTNDVPYYSDVDKNKLSKLIAAGFNNSEFPTTTSSTTEPKFLVRTISTITDEIERWLK